MIQPNNTKNVSVGKGVKGGYAFSAPMGTPVPTDIETPLDGAFVNLGYITEDGIVFGVEDDNEDFPDMNGDTIETASSSHIETIVMTLAETKKETLQEAYGHGNVTDADGLIVARHNSNPKDNRIYVFELLLRDGRRQRSVAANGKVTEVGETTYQSSELVAREVTVSAFPDENGDYIVDYIESTETEPPFSKQVVVEQPVLTEPFEGKTLNDLVGENYTVETDGTTIKATGDVYKVEGWSAYSKAEQDKYYPVIRIDMPEGTVIETQTLSGKERKITLEGPDDLIIAVDQEHTKRTLKISESEGSDKTATFVFDASGCNLTNKE